MQTNGKGLNIAKQILKAKLQGQNAVLKKYGLKPLDHSALFKIGIVESENLKTARKKLILIESHNAKRYFNQIFSLFPEKIRPERRTGYKAYDGLNNVFNFAYYVLKCRVHKALLKAKLEPYLGFLHSVQYGKPSLVCDFQELYRYLIDDYLIERCKKLRKKDFVVVTDFMMRLKMGKRIHLCEYEADSLAEALNNLFESEVDIPRIRYGKKQTIDTLISEEALLLAKYLRNEKPRLDSENPNGITFGQEILSQEIFTRRLLPRKPPNIKQELPVNKKRLITAAFISILLMSQVAGLQFVNLARADATTFSDISLGTILPDSNTKPPVISIFAPENNTVYATNTISLSVNVSVGESNTAYSKYIEEVYCKPDWQINNTYIYESNPTKSVYSTEPAQFSKTMNLTGIPDGNHSLVVYAKERGAYHSHSDYSPPVWYFYYYLFKIDGSSTVFFTVDTTAPRITVLSLEKQTFYTSNVPLNFTVNELTTQIKYSLDGQENTTIAGNETLTNLPYGDHNIRIFATDEAGNTGTSETITFTVAVPFLTALVIASVITVAVVGIGLLVYFKKRKR